MIDFLVEDFDGVVNFALDYNDFKLDEVKHLCKECGLSFTRKKRELVDQLQCFDELGYSRMKYSNLQEKVWANNLRRRCSCY